MSETNAQWSDLHLFLAVARQGGLSPAARATGRSAATLGRRMLALERAMGRELFIRHDRGYELTADAHQLLKQLTDVEVRIARLTTKPANLEQPLIKVSAGTWTTLALLRKLDRITGTPADLRLRFIQAENTLDIPHREVVIGFRNQRPTEEGLAGRKLSCVEFAPYAAPDVAEKWIKVIGNTPSARWLEKTVGNDAVCEVTAPRSSLDLALAGAGIVLLPTFVGDYEEGLQKTGETIPELTHDQWIVTHQDDRHLPEVRRAIDRLCAVLESFP